jgi:hypothetical protein
MSNTDTEMKEKPVSVDGFVIRKYVDGEPCQRNCERHVTHPCERCGRIMARGNIDLKEFNV